MRTMFLILIISISGATVAEQSLTVKPNTIVKAKISADDMTRVYIKDDAFTDAWTTSQNLNIQQDNDNGELYITLRDPENIKPASVFALTEKGERVNLMFTMDLKGAETITLKQEIKDGIYKNNVADTHETRLINLIKAMHLGQEHSGYEIKKLSGTAKSLQGLKVTKKYQYTSDNRTAQAMVVKNNTKTDVYINEHIIDEPGKLAVATLDSKLRPGEETIVYVVREYVNG